MKLVIAPKLRFSIVIAVTLSMLVGCASPPKADVENNAAQVKVYETDQLLQAQYEHVRYLWADSWRTALWLPIASSEAEGITALQTEAARLGANGLINVSCVDQGRTIRVKMQQPAIICYGHAIRVR